MTIGILLHPYGEKYKAGLGEYILSLTRALIENDSHHQYIVYIKKGSGAYPVFKGSNWRVVEVGGGALWRDIGLLLAPKSDLYIFNTPILPLFYCPGKTLAIVLDFAYWYLPVEKLSYRLRNLGTFVLHWLSIKRANALVAISEATRQDVVRLCGIAPKRVQVIYPGIRDLSQIPEVKPAFTLPESYFFYTGVLKPRKNALGLVQGFIKAKQESAITDTLLIAGKGGGGPYLDTIKRTIAAAHMEQKVRLIGYLSEGELAYVMKRAKAFVFPSIFEGFGMPVVEAMKCGTPVITSNVSALREAGAGASIQVDPLSVGEIAQAMMAMQDEVTRKKYIALGYAKARTFTWNDCARLFYAIFKKEEHKI